MDGAGAQGRSVLSQAGREEAWDVDELHGWRVEVGAGEDGLADSREPIAEVHVLIFDWAPQQVEIRVGPPAVPDGRTETWQRRTIDHAIEELRLARDDFEI